MFACVDGWGKKEILGARQGAERGLKNRAVDPEHGTGMGRSSPSRTKGNHPKQEDFLIRIKSPQKNKIVCTCFILPCA
jgi:hypothetical protein